MVLVLNVSQTVLIVPLFSAWQYFYLTQLFSSNTLSYGISGQLHIDSGLAFPGSNPESSRNGGWVGLWVVRALLRTSVPPAHWFSTRVGLLGQCLETVWVWTLGGRMLLASSGERPGVLLSIFSAQNVASATAKNGPAQMSAVLCWEPLLLVKSQGYSL